MLMQKKKEKKKKVKERDGLLFDPQENTKARKKTSFFVS
jgi:hypothetical protein